MPWYHPEWLRPLWLLFIPVAWLLIYYLYVIRQHKNTWQAYCDPELLAYLSASETETRNNHIGIIVATLCTLTLTALAGPSWQKQATPTYQSHSAHVFVLDLSIDMLAEDLKPNRLQRAKYKIIDAIDSIDDGGIGLVVFSDSAHVVAPITTDKKTIKHLLNVLHPGIMPGIGHNLNAGLETALDLLKNQHSRFGEIVLATVSTPDESAQITAQDIAHHHFQLSILGSATNNKTPISINGDYLKTDDNNRIYLSELPTQALQSLASSANGRYQQIRPDRQDIQRLITHFDQIEHATASKQVANIWQDNGYYFVWLLLPLMIAMFRRGLWD